MIDKKGSPVFTDNVDELLAQRIIHTSTRHRDTSPAARPQEDAASPRVPRPSRHGLAVALALGTMALLALGIVLRVRRHRR